MDLSRLPLLYLPVSALTMLVNIYLIFCMLLRQQGTEHLKQPLTVLLGTLVGCNVTLQICIFLFSISRLYSANLLVNNCTANTFYFTMWISVTSSLWLNVFYYFQIVPAQSSVFIYLKRNIKLVIFSCMIAEKIFLLLGFSVNIAFSILLDQRFSPDHYSAQWNKTYEQFDMMFSVLTIDTWFQFSYLSFCLCLMLTSSCATIIYLLKHMKSMAGSGSFSSPRLHKQMRVTITGFVQIFLFFFCLIWMMVNFWLDLISVDTLLLADYIDCTVVCLYSFATTINLCIGQTIFRQRVFQVWQKCLQIVSFLSK